MTITQIYNLMNDATNEALGLESNALLEDLSNVVEIGRTIENASGIDAYCKALVNQIGKMYFNDRVYKGEMMSLMRDAWEYGSILARVSTDLPTAVENESWELQNGATYSNEIFYQPTVTAKFYNKLVTFECDMSFTDKQIKQSFASATQANAFITMIYTSVDNSMTIKTEQLIKRAVNNMIALTAKDDYGANAFSSKSGTKAVNLLYLYNTAFSQSLNANDALTDKDFIQFACYTMKNYVGQLRACTTLYNIDKKPRFTNSDNLHWFILDKFKNGADVYLQSDTFHNEFTKLPEAESVAYWQNVGDFSFTKAGEIKITDTNNDSVNLTGILAVMCDTYAVAVCNTDKRTTSSYNAKAEFYTNYYKSDMELINCTDENFVVFFVA